MTTDGRAVARSGSALRRWLRGLRWWQESLLLVLVAVVVAVLLRTFLVALFLVPSGSMEQTLRVGDRILVDRTAYDLRTPRRGEVVVFRGTDGWAPETGSAGASPVNRLLGAPPTGQEDYVKRVVGLPGDVVACCDRRGRVTVDMHPLDEPYVFDDPPVDTPPSPGECRARRFGPYRVPAGGLFVLGDHRAVSQDSRCRGVVSRADVIGRAIAVAWPPGHWRVLGVPGTFRKVP